MSLATTSLVFLLADVAPEALVGGALAALGLFLLSRLSSAAESLRQAKALAHVLPLAEVADRVGERVCVAGEPKTDEQFLWMSLDHQVYVSGHDGSGGWQSSAVEHVSPNFTLHDEGGQVKVFNRPTEVHGCRKDTIRGRHAVHRKSARRTLDGERGNKRTLRRVLPHSRRLVACGRVRRNKDSGELMIDRDPKLGLLLSTRAPALQATLELLKGAAVLLLAPALLGVGAWLVSNHL
jgi:hypothetical protein